MNPLVRASAAAAANALGLASALALLWIDYQMARPHWLYHRALYRILDAPLSAALPLPVRGARGLRDSWQAHRSGGRRHEGIDIFAPCGTPVLSTTEGVVASMGENALGGRTVSVLGPGRSWHYYAHLSAYGDRQRRDLVRAGDVLGYVGTTGNAEGTPCHLHYGVYLNGRAVNPYPYLAAKAAPAPSPAVRPGR